MSLLGSGGIFIMKKCSNCGKVKLIEEFHRRKRVEEDRNTYCKMCDQKIRESHRRTLKGKALQIFSTQKKSSKNRNHQPPSYTKDEFIEWLLSNEYYLRIHSEWVESEYDKLLAPSVDRLDDYKGYSFDNIQIVTWKDNLKKSYSDIRNGINNKKSKTVIKCDLNGNEIEEYHSIQQAARCNGSYRQGIIRVCKGKAQTAGGFRWKYAEHT